MVKRRKNIKLPLIIITFVLAFAAWYFIVYIPEKEQSIVPGLFPEPSKISEHILWGVPAEENAKLYLYQGLAAGYDHEKKNPDWVSYHLVPLYFSGKKFQDKRRFKSDPAIRKPDRVLTSDYTRSGFDRGHLAPQADMKGRSEICEKQACYLTNIVPQKPSFNRKTWLNLEKAVRKWTDIYGEAWIVTGPWYDDKQYLLKKKIEIPDGFYKVVILKKNNSYTPLAFVLDQDDVSYDLKRYQVSIDSVESLTGIDLFHKLPDSLEDRFESSIHKLPAGWK